MDNIDALQNTARFFELLHLETEKANKNLSQLVQTKWTGKGLETFLVQLSKMPSVIKSNLKLKKSKSNLLIVALLEGDINPINKRKERLAFARCLAFGKEKFDKHDEQNVRFSISHHCIMRLFERIDFTNDNQPRSTLRHVFNQLDYLPIIQQAMIEVLVKMSSINFQDSELGPKNIIQMIANLPIFMPSPDGVLVGEIQGTGIHVRTFYSREMVSEEERALLEDLEKFLVLFKNSHAIYQRSHDMYFSNIQRQSADLILEMIAYKLTEYLAASFRISTKINSTKKAQLKSLFRFIKLQNKFEHSQEILSSIGLNGTHEFEEIELTKFLEKQLRKAALSGG